MMTLGALSLIIRFKVLDPLKISKNQEVCYLG